MWKSAAFNVIGVRRRFPVRLDKAGDDKFCVMRVTRFDAGENGPAVGRNIIRVHWMIVASMTAT